MQYCCFAKMWCKGIQKNGIRQVSDSVISFYCLRRRTCLYARRYIPSSVPAWKLCKAVDVEHEAALDVCGLVLVDRVVLSELVEHLLYFGKHLYCGSLVGGSAELASGVTHGLGIITVVETTSGSLTDALYR